MKYTILSALATVGHGLNMNAAMFGLNVETMIPQLLEGLDPEVLSNAIRDSTSDLSNEVKQYPYPCRDISEGDMNRLKDVDVINLVIASTGFTDDHESLAEGDNSVIKTLQTAYEHTKTVLVGTTLSANKQQLDWSKVDFNAFKLGGVSVDASTIKPMLQNKKIPFPADLETGGKDAEKVIREEIARIRRVNDSAKIRVHIHAISMSCLYFQKGLADIMSSDTSSLGDVTWNHLHLNTGPNTGLADVDGLSTRPPTSFFVSLLKTGKMKEVDALKWLTDEASIKNELQDYKAVQQFTHVTTVSGMVSRQDLSGTDVAFPNRADGLIPFESSAFIPHGANVTGAATNNTDIAGKKIYEVKTLSGTGSTNLSKIKRFVVLFTNVADNTFVHDDTAKNCPELIEHLCKITMSEDSSGTLNFGPTIRFGLSVPQPQTTTTTVNPNAASPGRRPNRRNLNVDPNKNTGTPGGPQPPQPPNDDSSRSGSDDDSTSPKNNGKKGKNNKNKGKTKTKDDSSSDKEKTHGKSACFSGSALVTTPTGSTPMNKLKQGDMVLTSTGYEQVLTFLHAEQGTASFLEISHPQGVLPVTPDHLLFLADGTTIPAGMLQVGDMLTSGAVASIKKVVRHDGIYAPLTSSGTVIVNNVVASTYSYTAKASAFVSLYHAMAHFLLTPLRWSASMGTSISHDFSMQKNIYLPTIIS